MGAEHAGRGFHAVFTARSVHMWNALSQELKTDFEVAIEGGLTVADDEQASSISSRR